MSNTSVRFANLDFDGYDYQTSMKEPTYERTTLWFPNGKRAYHYADAGRDRFKRRIWFCWSCHRNMAGYFVGWRERRNGRTRQGERDMFVFRRSRKKCEAIANRRAERYKAQRAT